MDKKKKILLVGDFDPVTLERWVNWAESMDTDVERHANLEAIKDMDNPVVILAQHGLNDAPLPE